MTEKEQVEDKTKFPILLMDNILRVFHGVNTRLELHTSLGGKSIRVVIYRISSTTPVRIDFQEEGKTL